MRNGLGMRADLHTHSTASDGEMTPAALVHYARERGLGALALTDHDSVAGLDTASQAARRVGIDFVPGVELSCDVPQNEVHILGYFIRWHDPHFLTMLARFRESRYGRAEKMVRKLTALGAPIAFERVKQIAGDAPIGRPHIAQALVEAGHVSSVPEAFERFIGRNGPAYVQRFRLTPADAVALILRAGGVPVLAHPHEVTHYVEPLVKVGLVGLEALYGLYDTATRAELVRLARRYDLIVTGGSDFHGLNHMAYLNDLGDVEVPVEVVAQLRARAEAL
jgi:predicted metal-dependent phosphoesterase TrpH